ncbi:TetR/AcrR family transcriptional regulator [Actinomycetes bacterium KLBMP 9759]
MARQASADSRERILDTAARLFYENGIRAVGVQQVIDECGCGKNLLYQQFASKDELIVAYVERYRRDWTSLVAGATAGLPDDAAEHVLAIVRLVVEQTREPDYRGCVFRICHTEFPGLDHPAARAAVEHLHETRAHIGALARRIGGAHPQVLADQIWLVVEGIYATAAHDRAHSTGDVAVNLVRQLIANARPTGEERP